MKEETNLPCGKEFQITYIESLPQRVRQTFPLPRCGVNTVIFQKEGVKNMNFIVKKYDKLYLSQVMKASINTYK